MARHASTYRKYRRENWKLHNALEATKLTWEEFNRAAKLKFKNKPDILIGNVSSLRTPSLQSPLKTIAVSSVLRIKSAR